MNLFILFLRTCYIFACFQLVAFVREHIWLKALLMGYSIRLELTLISSLNNLWLVWRFLYRGHFPSFLECVYFGLLYASLIFDMFIVVHKNSPRHTLTHTHTHTQKKERKKLFVKPKTTPMPVHTHTHTQTNRSKLFCSAI